MVQQKRNKPTQFFLREIHSPALCVLQALGCFVPGVRTRASPGGEKCIRAVAPIRALRDCPGRGCDRPGAESPKHQAFDIIAQRKGREGTPDGPYLHCGQVQVGRVRAPIGLAVQQAPPWSGDPLSALRTPGDATALTVRSADSGDESPGHQAQRQRRLKLAAPLRFGFPDRQGYRFSSPGVFCIFAVPEP